MSQFEKSMEEIFNVSPIVEPENKISVIKTDLININDNLDLDQDLIDAYQQTKENLQDLIDNGKEALDDIIQIAKEGQHPRAFEVASGLLKNMVDANKELLNIQKQIRDMDNKKKDTGGTTIDKAIFVGSTTELNKLLKGKID